MATRLLLLERATSSLLLPEYSFCLVVSALVTLALAHVEVGKKPSDALRPRSPLLKVDTVCAVHLCDHLLHGPSNLEAFLGQSTLSSRTLRLVRLVGMVQVRGPFATATMDTLDQT